MQVSQNLAFAQHILPCTGSKLQESSIFPALNYIPSEELILQVASIKEKQTDEYGQLHASGLHCAGRIILNMWRLLRSEIKLNIYTFESCVAALLQQRTPRLPPWLLNQCFKAGPGGKQSVPSHLLSLSLVVVID